MVDIKDFNIEREMHKQDKNIPTIFIPRYINYDDGRPTKTIQDFGWHPNVECGHTHLVHYCNRCRCQRTFTILSEIKKISKEGREYVVGYYGYCNYCQENQWGDTNENR